MNPRSVVAQRIDDDIETYLARRGRVFRVFHGHDSGCTSYGVEVDGVRWFVKHSATRAGLASLRGAQRVSALVQHPALPRLWQALPRDAPSPR